MTRPREQRIFALSLHRNGRSPFQIARLTGLPYATVRGWTHPRYVPRGRKPPAHQACFRCDDEYSVPVSGYAYLLGTYLVDGCLTQISPRSWRLRISQDARYTDLIDLCGGLVESISGAHVYVIPRVGCVEIAATWSHWPHLFPQHGAGMKYKRRILLQPWQSQMVDAAPQFFVQGLIQSDGSRFMNVVSNRRSSPPRRYAYPRYYFTNASDDIRKLFTDACDRLACIGHRPTPGALPSPAVRTSSTRIPSSAPSTNPAVRTIEPTC